MAREKFFVLFPRRFSYFSVFVFEVLHNAVKITLFAVEIDFGGSDDLLVFVTEFRFFLLKRNIFFGKRLTFEFYHRKKLLSEFFFEIGFEFAVVQGV